MKIKKTPMDYIFDTCNVTLMILLMLVTLYPVYYVFIASVTSNTELLKTPGFMLFPKGFNLGAFTLALRHPLLLSGYRNTLFILIVSLPINILLTLFCGYFMASRNVLFRGPIVIFILFTMWFNAGLVPTYLNIQSLGLINSLWALILPGSISVYNSIICKTAIEAVPPSMAESAYMDGANDFTIVFRIIFPLIMPTIAVLLLYYGVAHWNAWFPATLYIRENELMPIQNLLRAILINASSMLQSGAGDDDRTNQYAESIKYAAIVMTTVPVLFIYPFLQKYFVKGVMIGAVKG